MAEGDIWNYVGMLGFPLLPVSQYDATLGHPKAAFFTMHALKDPELPAKLKHAMSSGVLLLVTDGLKIALAGKVSLSGPNVLVLPVSGKPTRALLDSPPTNIVAIRKKMLQALGWTLEAPASWIGLYLFTDGSYVIENFANASVSLSLGSVDAEPISFQLQGRAWKHEWHNSVALNLTPATATARSAPTRPARAVLETDASDRFDPHLSGPSGAFERP